jgi:protein-S-isoprenylcysteine O-methyltransferase Ste14
VESDAPKVAEPTPARDSLQRWLCSPWVDRLLALGLVLTQTGKVYRVLFRGGDFQIQYLGLILNFLVYAFYTLFRRPPVRVSVNPLYWAVSIASNWSGVVLTLYQPADARQISPQWAITAASVLSAILVLVTRVSLGRSFGLVPALRAVVTRGAYQWVRHPVYAAASFSMVPVLLSRFSWSTCALVVAAILLMVFRAELEEEFLSSDPGYAEYLTQVRWRMFPGLY